MNISVSQISNLPKAQNTSFGLAKFSPQGLQLAQSCSDIYECLGNPNEFQNPDFFKKKGIFSQAPFTKYLKTKLSQKNINDTTVNEVKSTIVDCGATENSHTNASFIKQLVASKKFLDKLDTKTRTEIATATEEVFKHNWNNPELSKEETYQLLEMSKLALQDTEYATLTGVIQKSDI